MATQLSYREYEILMLIAYEKTTSEIACILHISKETARSHRKNAMQKLAARNSAGLIRKAFELGILRLRNESKNDHISWKSR